MLKMTISQEIININSNWYCIIHQDPSDFGPTNQNPSKPDINTWMISKKKIGFDIHQSHPKYVVYPPNDLLISGSAIHGQPDTSAMFVSQVPNSNHANHLKKQFHKSDNPTKIKNHSKKLRVLRDFPEKKTSNKKPIDIFWLVVLPILKNMSSSVGKDDIPYIKLKKKKKTWFETTNQISLTIINHH